MLLLKGKWSGLPHRAFALGTGLGRALTGWDLLWKLFTNPVSHLLLSSNPLWPFFALDVSAWYIFCMWSFACPSLTSWRNLAPTLAILHSSRRLLSASMAWLALRTVCSAHRSRDGVDGEGKEGIAKQLFSSNLFNFLRTHMCLTTTYLRGLALEKRSLQHGLVFSCLLVGKSRILTGARWEWLLGSSIQPQQHSQLSIVHEMESRASCYRCSDCILHGL